VEKTSASINSVSSRKFLVIRDSYCESNGQCLYSSSSIAYRSTNRKLK